MTTFGFESEWGANARPLVQLLHRRGMTGCDDLHSYHCSCDTCNDGLFPLKAQRDSSCDGELISRILTFDDEVHPREVMDSIQDAAVEADAEPGFDAGFHVHVDTSHLGTHNRHNTLWAFLRWEPVLLTLAAGRYQTVRDNNETVYSQLRCVIRDYVNSDSRTRQTGMLQLAEQADLGCIKERCLEWARDRHSNLNTYTPYGTWEFRLWNSTRAAWRMEMFVRTSIAMTDQNVVGGLLDGDVPAGGTTNANVRRLCRIFDINGHDRAAELAARQLDYLERAEPIPAALTNF